MTKKKRQPSTRRAWFDRSTGFSALAGAVIGACWLPILPAALYPIGFAFWHRALASVSTTRQAIVAGAAFSAAMYAVGGYFLLALLRFSPLAIFFFFIAILQYVPFGVAGTWGAFRVETRSGISRHLALVFLFPICEYLHTLGDVSFPVELIAHGMGTTPRWLAWTSIAGPHIVAAWAVAVGALIHFAIDKPQERRPRLRYVGSAIGLWFLPLVLSAVIPAGGGPAGTLRVGIVQPSFSVELKQDQSQREAKWETVETLTRRAGSGVDLVLWPETTRPEPLVWNRPGELRDERVSALAREAGVPILYGAEIAVLEQGKIDTIYNGAVLVDAQGNLVDWYGKQYLLPFAEGFPFAHYFGYKPARRLQNQQRSVISLIGNMSMGPELTVFEVGDAKIGVEICYESFYPKLARRYRNRGANVLAVMTNDAWWGSTMFPYVHAQIASARAREGNLPVVRAANNGISSATAREGSWLQRTNMNDVRTMTVEVELGNASGSVYTRFGEWFVALCALLAIAAWFRPRPHP